MSQQKRNTSQPPLKMVGGTYSGENHVMFTRNYYVSMVTDTMADTHSRSISASEVVSLATEPYSLSFTKDSNRRKSNKGVYKG